MKICHERRLRLRDPVYRECADVIEAPGPIEAKPGQYALTTRCSPQETRFSADRFRHASCERVPPGRSTMTTLRLVLMALVLSFLTGMPLPDAGKSPLYEAPQAADVPTFVRSD
jgi:hypothetical protein